MKFVKQDIRTFKFWVLLWGVFLAIALLVSPIVNAQISPLNCDALVVTDGANVLSGASEELARGAQAFIDQGTEVHIFTVSGTKADLASYERSLENFCGWKAKANLFVIAVAPNARQKQSFFHGAYTPAFNTDQATLIYSKAANPYFRQGDFAGGIAAALRDYGAAVAAYHDQQKHPVQSSTVIHNEAVNYHGLWVLIGWILFAVFLAVLGWILYGWYEEHQRKLALIRSAQVSAQTAKANATRAYQSKENPTSYASKRFLDLSDSVSNDPDVDGLDAAAYGRIRQAWQDFYEELYDSRTFSEKNKYTSGVSSSGSSFSPSPVYSDSTPVHPVASPISHHHHHHHDHVTVVNNGSNNDGMLTGVIIGEEMAEIRQPRYVPEPSYVPEPTRYSDPDPSPSFGSSSDSGWGSSSSDSGSSSSSDWGSSSSDSSSFDSGSSDSSGW